MDIRKLSEEERKKYVEGFKEYVANRNSSTNSGNTEIVNSVIDNAFYDAINNTTTRRNYNNDTWNRVKSMANDNLNRFNNTQKVMDRNTRNQMAKTMEDYTNLKRVGMQNASNYVQEKAKQEEEKNKKNDKGLLFDKTRKSEKERVLNARNKKETIEKELSNNNILGTENFFDNSINMYERNLATHQENLSKEQSVKKNNNILQDLLGLGKITGSGVSSGTKEVLNYVESTNEKKFSNYKNLREMQFLTSPNVSRDDKAKVQFENDKRIFKSQPNYGLGNIDLNNRKVAINEDGSISTVRSMSFQDEDGKEVLIPTVVDGKIVSDDEAIQHYYNTGEYLGKFDTVEEAEQYAEQLHKQQNVLHNKEGIETNLVKKAIRDSIAKDEQKIQEEQSKLSNKVAQKFGEIAPSMGQMLPGMALSTVNPVLGTSYFMTSAGGGYINDGLNRGMTEEEAWKYGTVMGAIEGASESFITGQQVNKIANAFGGKQISKKVLDSYGFNIFENAVQEAVMEPAQEITAGIIGDKADWSNMGQRMMESGFNGALMGAITNGVTYGLEKSGIVYNKIKNNEQVTVEEYKEALQENIDRFGKNAIEDSIKKGALETYEEINNATKLQQNALANNRQTVYNNNESVGGVSEQRIDTRGDEFRRLQEESRRIANSTSWEQRDSKIDGREQERIRGILQRQVQSSRISNSNSEGINVVLGDKIETDKTFNMYSNIDAKTFRDMFEIARTYTKNGELVDLHNLEEYKNTKNYLSEDGTSGFSITKDGDLISVFNAKSINNKKGFLKAIAPEVKKNTKTLDCFMSVNQPLNTMYEKYFGFKTASVMEYNMQYDHDNIGKNHNYPQVAFMVNTQEDVPIRHFTKDQYNEAIEYRNKFINNRRRTRRY